jgi:hypothetical protein
MLAGVGGIDDKGIISLFEILIKQEYNLTSKTMCHSGG